MSDLPPLASLLDHVGEAIVLLRVSDDARTQARIVAVNSAFTRLTGLHHDRIVGRSLRALRSPAHRQGFARLQAAMVAGEPFDGRLDLAASDGAPIPATARGLPFPRDDRHYVLLMERMPADAGVRKIQDMVGLAASLASACLYVLRVGADCRLELEWADASIERLTGHGVETLRAAGGLTAFVAEEDLEALARRNQAVLAGRQGSVDYRLRHRDGAERWLRDVARPEPLEPDGRITRVVGSLVDVGHEHRPARGWPVARDPGRRAGVGPSGRGGRRGRLGAGAQCRRYRREPIRQRDAARRRWGAGKRPGATRRRSLARRDRAVPGAAGACHLRLHLDAG